MAVMVVVGFPVLMPNPSPASRSRRKRRRAASEASFADSEQYRVTRVQLPDAAMLETMTAFPESWRVWVRQLVAVLGLLRSAAHLVPGSSALPVELQATLGHLLPFLRSSALPAKPGRSS